MLFVSFVASARAEPLHAPRVRMQTRVLESLFRTALDRSPTFEAIVRELEASDLIVYVDRSTRLPLSIRGGIAFRGAGTGVRYLDVLLNPRYTRQQMIAALGHELQHAVEVARAPHVTSVEAFSRHYHRVGFRGASDNWDTPEAQHAGRKIAREVARSGRETLAESDADSGQGRRGKSARKGRRADQAVSHVPHATCAPRG